MSTMNAAVVENNVVVTVAVFTVADFPLMQSIWPLYFPGQSLIPMDDLPEGLWVGWRLVDGVWTAP